ncbi:antitermination protein [Escherichia coli]|nr:antitermination protein [Escherichia coli]
MMFSSCEMALVVMHQVLIFWLLSLQLQFTSPPSAAYRAVTMLIPNLTQPTWSRTVKPLYDALVVQCHKEESIADSILNTVTR